jgi:hypothetical protein
VTEDTFQFGLAVVKEEGKSVQYIPGEVAAPYVGPRTVYVERRIPEHLEHAANEAIDKFLQEHGYNSDEI